MRSSLVVSDVAARARAAHAHDTTTRAAPTAAAPLTSPKTSSYDVMPMLGADLSAGDASGALHRELRRERLRGLHRINLLRLGGVSAFFALFVLLGGILRLPAWMGNLELFAVYWASTLLVFWASRRFESIAPLTSLAIGVVDVPMVFCLQWATLDTSPSASGVAGFTVGIYVLFVILAALCLERWYVLFTAASGTVFEVLLQHLAGVGVGAMISTVILLGVTTVACSYARERLVALIGRVEAAAQVEADRRRAEDRLREATSLLGIAQTLSGVTEVQEALRRICRELARLLGAETVAAYLVDRERAELMPCAGYRVPKDALAEVAASRVPVAAVGFTAELERGGVVACDNVPESPDFDFPLARRVRHQSALLVPLVVERQVAGGFYLVWWTARRAFVPAELALAEVIGQQVGRFVENARLYEELQKTYQRSVQVQRLRALGEMSAGVAHDFNNLLAIILGRTELLQATVQSGDAKRSLKIIEKAALDGARTVRRIHEFTRRAPARPLEPVDLSAAVRDVVEMTRASWQAQALARGIRYEVATEGERPLLVLGDASDLREALTNLVLNALDAMPEGGRLTMKTAGSGDRVRCDVTDSGVGMPEEVRERVFEPFFSTKLDKGSGLGLSVVYSIVKRLGGDVTVESVPGRGSTFSLWLARAVPGGDAAKEAAAPQPPLPRRGRILVVDDDAEVRQTMADVLALDGHQVVACADGASALRAVESEPFDLVITDLGMPGLGGWDVLDAVKQRRPGTPVGIITGWRDSLDPADAARRGADFLLSKPFRIDDVRDILGRWLAH